MLAMIHDEQSYRTLHQVVVLNGSSQDMPSSSRSKNSSVAESQLRDERRHQAGLEREEDKGQTWAKAVGQTSEEKSAPSGIARRLYIYIYLCCARRKTIEIGFGVR